MSIVSSPPPQTTPPPATRLFAGLRIVSLCTLLSRVLGLVRDVGMASLFGNGMVMDAFSVAFRIPNLSRKLFGEGALSTAFLPAFVREMQQSGQASAWRLASAVFTTLALALSVLVLVAELTLWGVSSVWDFGQEAELLIGLTAVMLPYLVLICLAAQVGAVLHALGHFTWPALLPVLLNVVWIAAIWFLAPQFASPTQQINALAGCIVVTGLLQLVAPLPTLWRLGFRYDRHWQSARQKVTEMTRVMLPVLVGLSVTQLNTLCDSLIAWGFSRPVGDAATTALFGVFDYPLRSGTASALYFGQRMYQFPLGVFGAALGTVLFPLLSRHAERGQLDRLRDDLTLGLRLVIVIGLPAGLGLMLLAKPLTTLLFQHGAFDSQDANQTADMISAYAIGVWAYCGLLIVHRGYYAIGDRRTPLRVAIMAVLLNLGLNLTLIWSLGGRGLALSTSVCAIVQVSACIWLLRTRLDQIDWRRLLRIACRTCIATAAMSLVCLVALQQTEPGPAFTTRLLRVFVPMLLSIVTYFAAAKLLGLDELWLLFKRQHQSDDRP